MPDTGETTLAVKIARDDCIERLYTEEEWSRRKIANHYGMTTGGVGKILDRRGIPWRKMEAKNLHGSR